MKEKILFGISSGIAAYKVIDLIDLFRQSNEKVVLILTKNAEKMLGEFDLDFHSEMYPDDFDYKEILNKREVDHINIADSAKVFCIAPATANIIAKLANGIADDFLTTTALAVTCPIILVPSMNVNMWNNSAVQENLKILSDRGYIILEPDSGPLACGYEGKGRLPEINFIKNEVEKIIQKSNLYKGKKILVTAGGTQEKIDDVRVITNNSSGKMGIAIAQEAFKYGAEVTMILGNVDIKPRFLGEFIYTKSSDEMYDELKDHVVNADIIFHAAAVSDFKPEKVFNTKISSSEEIELKLSPTIKIIDKLRKFNPKAKIIGFKAETNISEDNLLEKASNLLDRAKLDAVVANDVGKNNVFGSDENEVYFVTKNDSIFLELSTKKEIAAQILVLTKNL